MVNTKWKNPMPIQIRFITSKGMERSLPSSMPVLDKPGFPACDLGKSTSICDLYEGKYLD